MNYNHNYVNYQTPNNAGYSYSNNGAPVYNAQPEGPTHHNGYYHTGEGQRPQVTQQYRQQYAQYPQNGYQNPYQQNVSQMPSPVQTGHPMVIVPQRSPVQTTYPNHSPAMSNSAPPTSYHQPQNNYHHSPPQQQHAHLPPQNTWQNYQQPQQLPLPNQYSNYPAQYSSHIPPNPPFAPTPQPRIARPQAMVEIPVASPRYPQNPPKPQQRSHHNVPTPNTTSSSPHITSASVAKKPAPPAPPPVDYQQLLLVLAEDYINAAHGMGSLVAFYRRAEDLKQYYDLMATGLGCIEASLREFRLLPQMEAFLTLQYANLLFQETENYDEVERWLSKAIPLCDRNRLLDLKYSMHHLSARTLFTTKPRVAMKALDTLIPDVHAYRHVPWIYALRFLRVSFSLRLGASHQDLASAIQNLHAISDLASNQNDAAISVTCATFEALLHLRSMNASCVEEAQRAVAAARSQQFHPLAQEMTQIWALLDCIELVCCLMQSQSDSAAAKASAIAPLMDQLRDAATSEDDGFLLVPLQAPPSSLTENTSGIFRRANGKDYLTFSWLHKRDLWTLCYLLSAVAVQAKNYVDPRVESYLREGLKILKENFGETSSGNVVAASISLSSAVERLDWWHNIRWYFHIFLSINASNRSDWTMAQKHLVEALSCPQVSSINSAKSRMKWEAFLQGSIYQATGYSDEALETFQLPVLQLSQSSAHSYDAEADLCVLAVLNSIMIILPSSHPQHHTVQALHASVTNIVKQHPNKEILAAYELLHTVIHTDAKGIDQKKHLMACIGAARTTANHQLTCISISLMSSMFFKDVVGDQAQKSVRSARALADKAQSNLWRSVTSGLIEKTASRHGNMQEAQKAGADAEYFVSVLPEEVKKRFEKP